MNRNPDSGAVPPKVSIGMPVYNGERFIRQAIESILAQSYPHFELIISDNASTDRTQEICAEYAQRDPRICYIRHERNMGAAWNFRFVLDAGRHEFFMWAACDDYRADSFLDRAVDMLGNDQSLACALGSIVFILEDGGNVVHEIHAERLFRAGDLRGFFLARELYFKCMFMYGLFRKEHLLKADWSLLADTDFWWNDALFLCSMVRYGGLRMFRGAPTMYRVNWASKVASVASRRFWWLYRITGLHPVSYYRAYFRLSRGGSRAWITLLIPVKLIKSMVEFHWFAMVKLRARIRTLGWPDRTDKRHRGV
jgi:glycosyltransferase involved in cell wall biosynthesis